MKPATKRFTTLTALALTSVLLLGACGNNKKEATLTSSSSKVSQKVKSTKPSSKEKAKKSEKRQNLLVQKKSQKKPLRKGFTTISRKCCWLCSTRSCSNKS